MESGSFKDEYMQGLREVIDEKIEAGGKELPALKGKPKQSTRVIDLVAVLQESLNQAKRGTKTTRSPGPETQESRVMIGRFSLLLTFAALRLCVKIRHVTL
jgi:non-homologous end joining protein Ku